MITAVFALATLAASAAAQGVRIAAPTPNTTMARGESIIIDVDRPATLTGSQEVAVAIGLLPCTGLAPAGTCDGVDPTANIGRVLYSGPYAPKLVGNGHADLAENFTVRVPDVFAVGPAMLSVAHFALIIGSEPFLEVVSEVVRVE